MVLQMIRAATYPVVGCCCHAFHSIRSLPKPAWTRVASQREDRRNLRLGRAWRSQTRAVPERGAGSDKPEADGEPDDNDPLFEAIQVMKEQGIRFEIDEEEDEDWDDILEDLDDPWMREPAPALEIEGGLDDGVQGNANEEPVRVADPYSPEGGFREISASELRQELEDSEALQRLPITVIDVRNTVEHAAGSIEGSMHIPLSHLNRDSVASCIGHRIVVLGSGSDERSRQAFVRLTRVYGFTDVRHLSGGITEWIEQQQK